MTKIQEQKCEMLLLWYKSVINQTHKKLVTMEEFDKRYKWLFRRRPYFYAWGPFYRDHGFVGLRKEVHHAQRKR